MDLRSNPGRPSEIGRPGRFGRSGRGGAIAGALLRGGELAGEGVSGATELGLNRGWVQKSERGTCSPLGYPGRWCGAESMVLDGEGGSVAKELAGVSVVWPLRCAKGEYN